MYYGHAMKGISNTKYCMHVISANVRDIKKTRLTDCVNSNGVNMLLFRQAAFIEATERVEGALSAAAAAAR